MLCWRWWRDDSHSKYCCHNHWHHIAVVDHTAPASLGKKEYRMHWRFWKIEQEPLDLNSYQDDTGVPVCDTSFSHRQCWHPWSAPESRTDHLPCP